MGAAFPFTYLFVFLAAEAPFVTLRGFGTDRRKQQSLENLRLPNCQSD